MATPGQLVQVMAVALCIPRATVFQYDRVLSEHGLRSKHGRGTSAAKVTSRDAANLLTAIAASSSLGLSAKDSAKICKTFSALRSLGPDSKSEVSKFGLESLAALPESHSFDKALAALIECAGQREFSRLNEGAVWVQFLGPIPSAQIVVESLFGIYADTRKHKRSPIATGLVHSSSVNIQTIRALGALVMQPGASDGN
jgi:hypothetical protein